MCFEVCLQLSCCSFIYNGIGSIHVNIALFGALYKSALIYSSNLQKGWPLEIQPMVCLATSMYIGKLLRFALMVEKISTQ